jgi:hypothetical protein
MGNQTNRTGYVPLAVELPPDVATEIAHAAAKCGISVSGYLMVAHEIAQGKVDRSMLGNVREIFTKDRAILEALAD